MKEGGVHSSCLCTRKIIYYTVVTATWRSQFSPVLTDHTCLSKEGFNTVREDCTALLLADIWSCYEFLALECSKQARKTLQLKKERKKKEVFP